MRRVVSKQQLDSFMPKDELYAKIYDVCYPIIVKQLSKRLETVLGYLPDESRMEMKVKGYSSDMMGFKTYGPKFDRVWRDTVVPNICAELCDYAVNDFIAKYDTAIR